MEKLMNYHNKKEIELIDCFSYLRNSQEEANDLYCPKCLSNKTHRIFRQFYNSPKIFIFTIYRQNKNKNITQDKNKNISQDIIFPEKLILDKNEEEKFIECSSSPKKYYLTGVIRRKECKEESYICYCLKKNEWVLYDDKNEKKVDFKEVTNNENSYVEMLFYHVEGEINEKEEEEFLLDN